jgi:ABC-2 type transport system permease protein
MNTYLRYELVRTFRNTRFVIFAFAFPVILYVVIAAPNRHVHDLGGTGLSAPLYYMAGLTTFAVMTAAVSSGARIAAERSVGWNRQLRITPLTSRAYLVAKVLTAYAMSLVSILLLYTAGIALGVRMSAGDWFEMTGLLLVGLIPFAALGILVGHVVSADTIGPVMGGTAALLALLGGTWFPVTSGAMYDIARSLPSYWLVQAGHVAIGGTGWGTLGWFVIAAWSIGLTALAARAYRRDTRPA